MKVGIQLFSVFSYMQKDPLAAIRQVANMGYRYLEGVNHTADKDYGAGFGLKAEDLQAVLNDTGSKMVSCHLMPIALENIDAMIDYQKKIGAKYIVDPAAFFTTRDEVLQKAELCNKIGEKCKAAGLQFLYHNHFHEFHHLGDDTIMELLMNNTDPELVGLELDTYWVMRGGVDPIDLMKQYGTRIKLIHQKDYPKGHDDQINFLATLEKANAPLNMNSFMEYNDQLFTEIGSGIMPVQKLIDAANEHCHSEYILLEQDYTTMDAMDSVKKSMDQFKSFTGIEW